MLWLITSIFVERFVQIYKYEKFLFSRSKPEQDEKPEEIVSNTDMTYDGQVSYHFKRKGGKSKPSAAPKPDERDKNAGKGTF